MDARHDRHAEIDRLAGKAQLEPAVLRNTLLGDVELRHDLHARDDRAVMPLVDRRHGRLQHAVDPVLHVDRVVLRLDVDVARTALDRRVDRRVHQPDDRARVGRELVDGQLVFARVVLSKQLDLEALGRLLQNALRALALLENGLDGRPGAHCHPDGRSELDGHLVDHREIGGIRDDDDQRLTVPSVRDEPVPQHEVGGNRPKELVIDAELAEIDELEPVALGQPPGAGRLERAIRRRRLAPAHVQLRLRLVRGRRWCLCVHSLAIPGVPGSARLVGLEAVRSHAHHRSALDRLKSGMYSDSSKPAITMPMTMRRIGSTSVTNRPRFVSISSS